jgi:hypothetical protein
MAEPEYHRQTPNGNAPQIVRRLTASIAYQADARQPAAKLAHRASADLVA